MSVPQIRELRAMSDEEIIAAHDKKAVNTEASVSYYLEELARRDQSGKTQAMLTYTRSIKGMTVVITAATIANLLIACLLVYMSRK